MNKPIIPIKPGTLHLAATELTFALMSLSRGDIDECIREVKGVRRDLAEVLKQNGMEFRAPEEKDIVAAMSDVEALTKAHIEAIRKIVGLT